VVEVNNLNEGLNLGSLVELVLAHGLNNLTRVSVNAGNYNIRKSYIVESEPLLLSK
jgi:hypothetical protein